MSSASSASGAIAGAVATAFPPPPIPSCKPAPPPLPASRISALRGPNALLPSMVIPERFFDGEDEVFKKLVTPMVAIVINVKPASAGTAKAFWIGLKNFIEWLVGRI